ncbi:MAG TPA: protein kinase [Gemmatimonadaceae bacterium]|nr:protein kinase [Gemmatimonadaceae bacterium]
MSADLRERLQKIVGPGCVIERELGGGGMSRVFVAHDTSLDRKIVIKVLLPDLTEAVSAERFKREIQIAARLQHPHIVPVLTAGSAGDVLYYTMPFVDGESLRGRISREGACSAGVTCTILRDSIRALSYAHRHGVVHRDIKPENILINDDNALIADFGVAKAVSAAAGLSQGLTTAGISVGTPAYMSPEQCAGDPAIDHRADIYSLGVVAYEMVAGSHPFSGRTPQQMMAAHVIESPPPLKARTADFPLELTRLIMRCLEKDPARRPQSADDMLHQLDSAVTPLGAVPSTPEARRRSRWKLAGALAAGAILLLVGGGLAFAPRDQVETALALMRRKEALLHPNRIIVVPFENETGDPRLASLGQMAADWLAQGLTSVGGVEIVDARTALVTGDVVDKIPWPFKSRNRSRAVAEETGAGIVLSGRIYRDGDTLRIQAKMNDAATGKLLRALTTVSGPADAPTKVLDLLNRRAVANVAQAMDTVATSLGTFSEPPSLEAYEATHKGIEAYFRGDTIGYAHLARAMALDSTYPTPVVLLAFSRIYRGHYEAADSLIARAEKLRERMAPADRAMLDHLDALLRADEDAALRTAEAFRRATPGSAESPLLAASTASSTGKPRRVLAILEQVDPDRGLNLAGAFYWNYKAGALVDLGRYDEGLEIAEKGLRRFPDEVSLIFIKGEALVAKGRLGELDDLIESAPASRTVLKARLAIFLATVLNSRGRSVEAAQLAGRWQSRLGPSLKASPRLKMARIGLLVAGQRWTEAQAAIAELSSRQDRDKHLQRDLLNYAGVVAVHVGDTALAKQIELRVVPTGRHDRGHAKVTRARIAAHLGERERAVELLQQARAEGLGLVSPGNPFQYDHLLLPLHGFAPFSALLKVDG